MSTPDPRSTPLDSAAARRLTGRLALRPGERALCVVSGSTIAARLAAYLVGPTGQVVETDYDQVVATGFLPYADGEFDAVLVDVAVADANLTRLLAEVARVSAATGRVAFAAVAPPDGDPAAVHAAAASAGLRGAVVWLDTEPGSDAPPVLLATAFPPPAIQATVGALGQDEGADTTAALSLPAWQGRSRRWPVAVAAAGVLVLAVAAGVGWGLIEDDPGRAESAGTGPGATAEAAVPSSNGPDGGTSGEPSPGAGSGSQSGSGSGSGSSGGGPPDNQPPVIEDAGVSSDGLTLTIAPTVSDPDGDDVSLSFEVDGDPVVATDPTRAEVVIDSPENTHDASVTITATDSRGASSWATVTHTLTAITTVSIETLNFTVSYTSCYAEEPARRMQGTLTLSFSDRRVPALNSSEDFSEEFRADRRQAILIDTRSAEVSSATDPSLTVRLVAIFAGARATLTRTHADSEVVTAQLFQGAPDSCQALLQYRVTFERR